MIPRIPLRHLLRRGYVPASLLVLLLIVLWTDIRLRPAPEHRMRRSAAMVECRVFYEIRQGDSALCFFRSANDSTLLGLSLSADSSKSRFLSAGLWLDRYLLLSSCHGRLATTVQDTTHVFSGSPLPYMRRQLSLLRKELRALNRQRKELSYYKRVHTVSDLGYGIAAAYAANTDSRMESLRKLIRVVEKAVESKNLKVVKHRSFTAYYHNLQDELRSQPMRLCALSRDRRLALLQTRSHLTPLGAEAVRMLPWQRTAERAIAVGFAGTILPDYNIKKSRPLLVPAVCEGMKHDAPALLVPSGSGIYNERGRFVGMTFGEEIIPVSELRSLFGKEASI